MLNPSRKLSVETKFNQHKYQVKSILEADEESSTSFKSGTYSSGDYKAVRQSDQRSLEKEKVVLPTVLKKTLSLNVTTRAEFSNLNSPIIVEKKSESITLKSSSIESLQSENSEEMKLMGFELNIV